MNRGSVFSDPRVYICFLIVNECALRIRAAEIFLRMVARPFIQIS